MIKKRAEISTKNKKEDPKELRNLTKNKKEEIFTKEEEKILLRKGRTRKKIIKSRDIF